MSVVTGLRADLASGHHAAIVPRLLVSDEPLGLSAELSLGTYERPGADVLAELEAAHLRGRGGAAFPAAVKWRAVALAEGPRVVVANGEEGEPASAKDQWLLTHRPHLVLDGLLLAAEVVGAARAVVYLSHPETVAAVRAAIAELGAAGMLPKGLQVDVHVVRPTYVAGEESALCRSINGGPALPTAKPPRPFERGVDDRPTLVSNVETLAHAAWISRHGAAAYREHGTTASPGTTLVTLGGACARPGVYEVPFGLTVGKVFADVAGGFTSTPRGFVMGGWFGGLLAAPAAETVCCYDAVRLTGSGLGCAAITALGADDDPLATASAMGSWYAQQSAQQCGVCVKGTSAISQALADLAAARGTAETHTNLARWGTGLRGRGACAFLDGAANLARSAVEQFPADVAARLVTTDFHTDQEKAS
jgi:NADH:ubiquinone oxidoreductase subunit F (NADH-binding)